jgi:hypothetical protein
MASASTRVNPAKRKQTTKARSPRSESPAAPFLRFHHSTALREKTLALIGTIEQADNPRAHREALSDLVMELTKSGMDAYFMQPLRLTRPGMLVEQSAGLGLAGVQQVMGSVVHQIIGRMNGDQLRSVCNSIRQFML